MVREPLVFVIVQRYSWLVRTLFYGLRLGAAAVVWPVASPVVFGVSMCVAPLFPIRS